MSPVTIRDHSPMDDYRKIQSQIRYTVQYAPFEAPEKPDRMENLTSSRSYNIFYRSMIKLLVLTGVGTVASIAAGIIFSYDSSSELKKIIFIILICATCAALGISLLIGGIGALIERCAEKKDREITINLDSKTWILNNGQIVISDEQKYRSMQQYDNKTILPISEAPFRKLKIIRKVYSIARVDGRIIVDAEITELYRQHPYVGGGSVGSEEDDADRIYYYRRRDRRDKAMWYENMYGRELLLQALNQLKQD